jgi:oligopeptide/dipeptide ABC transporter ATP-binding protein
VRIGPQIQETIGFLRGLSSVQAKKEACLCLEEAALRPAQRAYDLFPHQLSGGMCQRAMIALALAQDARIIVADEPTTALDKTMERSIAACIDKIKRERSKGILWITHDLTLIEGLADRVIVMYAGRFVETGPAQDVLGHPQHPYTQALIRCLPKNMREKRFGSIDGAIPDLSQKHAGCLFAPRCPRRMPTCLTHEPAMRKIASDHDVRCCLP